MDEAYAYALIDQMIDAAMAQDQGKLASLAELAEAHGQPDEPDQDPGPVNEDANISVQESILAAAMQQMGGQKKSAQLGMVGDEWHGPRPPGSGWVLLGKGPRGGKRWKKSGGGAQQPLGQDAVSATVALLAKEPMSFEVLTSHLENHGYPQNEVAQVVTELLKAGKLQSATDSSGDVIYSAKQSEQPQQPQQPQQQPSQQFTAQDKVDIAAGRQAGRAIYSEPPVSPEKIQQATVAIQQVLPSLLEKLKGQKFTPGVGSSDAVSVPALRKAVPGVSRRQFDDALRAMRYNRQIRLVAIGDRQGWTSEMLDGTIPGENEIFGYVEPYHDVQLGIKLGMVGAEWHGPQPPGKGWVPIQPGPMGGKRWKKRSGSSLVAEHQSQQSGTQPAPHTPSQIQQKLSPQVPSADQPTNKGPAHVPPIIKAQQEADEKFGATAPEVKLKKIIRGKGINEVFLVQQPDGSEAIFKPVYGEAPARSGVHAGTYWRREIASSQVAQALGFGDLVPVTGVAKLGASVGSSQAFVPNAVTAKELPLQNKLDGPEDSARAAVFDYLTGNVDRHDGNWMIDQTGKMKLIDNGLAFPSAYNPGDFANLGLIEAAVYRKSPLPDLSGWEAQRPALEQSLGFLDEPARKLTLERFDKLVAASKAGLTFEQLPGWGAPGTTVQAMADNSAYWARRKQGSERKENWTPHAQIPQGQQKPPRPPGFFQGMWNKAKGLANEFMQDVQANKPKGA